MSSTAIDPVSYLDNTGDDPTVRARLVVGDNDFHSVTENGLGISSNRNRPQCGGSPWPYPRV